MKLRLGEWMIQRWLRTWEQSNKI